MKLMENKKQTAVIWLQQGLETILTHEQQMQAIGLFVQAADMEKEQIMDAYSRGADDEYDLDWNPFDERNSVDCKQYYNETYGE
jgi:hypothetical protein